MSAGPLLQQLFRDADAEVARRLAAARAVAAGLEEGAAARLAAERDDALRARAKSLGAALERERSERERKRQFDLLTSRRRLVDRAIEVAMRRAPEWVGRAEVAQALQRMLRDALAYLPEGEAKVRCHPLLVPALAGADTVGSAPLHAEDGVPFGFVAESRDGRVRVDATLERLVARERERLSIALVKHHAEGGA